MHLYNLFGDVCHAFSSCLQMAIYAAFYEKMKELIIGTWYKNELTIKVFITELFIYHNSEWVLVAFLLIC